jgi:hypothetical protein
LRRAFTHLPTPSGSVHSGLCTTKKASSDSDNAADTVAVDDHPRCVTIPIEPIMCPRNVNNAAPTDTHRRRFAHVVATNSLFSKCKRSSTHARPTHFDTDLETWANGRIWRPTTASLPPRLCSACDRFAPLLPVTQQVLLVGGCEQGSQTALALPFRPVQQD